ncbi:hypothetical protein BOSP111201_24490 [Bordetella sputigena]|uniref:hypothetical protein n=1 Tax=Bordetella sputigena TaxID=1416810 RepID=UPI0039EFED2F
MALPPEPIDVAEVLRSFGCAADQKSWLSMRSEVDAIQQAMQTLMRVQLRPGEFAKAKALADASTAARAILAVLDTATTSDTGQFPARR